MDWNMYKSYTSTSNNFQPSDEFWKVLHIVNNSSIPTADWDDNNVVADVTDSYKELETVNCICNRCEHQHLATRVNDDTQQTLCDAWNFKRPISGSKTECSRFELRKGFEEKLING